MKNNASNIKAVVFDLDGTLFSSHKTIYLCTLRTFEELGMKANMPEERFYKLIGHHFREMFAEFNVYVDDLEGFIDIYKNFYFDYIDRSKAYPGVYDLIDYLYSRKIKIGLLTTKGQDQAERILRHFKIYDKFDYVMGRRPGNKIKPSGQPLNVIMSSIGVKDKTECLMVGDSELDILCGKNAGALTAAVTFGYRSREQLEKEKPDFIIDRISDIKKLVNGEDNV
jgi:phosphoglycolate phosphatase/pyrophosphatase PpaX